jgi:hypothetical protein
MNSVRTRLARARIIIKSACACALRCFTGYSNSGSIRASRARVCASSRSSFLRLSPINRTLRALATSLAFKPDWRECPALPRRQVLPPFSLEGPLAVRFQGPVSECNAITNRSFGESDLSLVSTRGPRPGLPTSEFIRTNGGCGHFDGWRLAPRFENLKGNTRTSRSKASIREMVKCGGAGGNKRALLRMAEPGRRFGMRVRGLLRSCSGKGDGRGIGCAGQLESDVSVVGPGGAWAEHDGEVAGCTGS